MKVWNSKDKKDKLKDVAVDLREYSLVAFDAEGGKHVAFLYDFITMRTVRNAKDALDRSGYRTDFADWDVDGRMTKLLEPFEN